MDIIRWYIFNVSECKYNYVLFRDYMDIIRDHFTYKTSILGHVNQEFVSRQAVVSTSDIIQFSCTSNLSNLR